MNVQRDRDASLAAWLEEGPNRLPDATRRAIAVQTRTTRQSWRPMWVPWRRPSMNPLARMAAAAIVVVAVIGGAIYALSPGGGVGGPPTPSPSPTPTAVPTLPASSQPSPTSAAASPSAYVSTGFEVPIQLTLADGWTLDSTTLGSVNLSGPSQPASIMSIASMTVHGPKPTDPWVPWPADIHAWLDNWPEFRPAAPRSITIGGRPASVIDVDVVAPLADTADWVRCGPPGTGCGINLRSANDSGVLGWRIHFVVIPTGNGTGIVGYTDAPSAGFQDAATSLDGLLATLQFR